MDTKTNSPADNQDAVADKKTERKNAIIGIVFILIVAVVIINLFSGNDESKARDDAELRVQNSVYTSVGIIPETQSTVVYKNKKYICVGVNYTFEDSFDTSVYWARIICWSRNAEMVVRSTDDVAGLDIHNLTKEQINQIKVLFELE